MNQTAKMHFGTIRAIPPTTLITHTGRPSWTTASPESLRRAMGADQILDTHNASR
jgi:hypothetical protein